MRPHLVHVFSTFGNGGPEVRTCTLIDATIEEFRHTVVSISGDLCAKARIRCADQVAFYAAPPKGGFYPKALARLLRSLQPDLVLTYGWGGVDALLAARLAGYSRVIHAEDGFLPDEAHRQKPRRLLARWLLLRLAKTVVCPSQNLVRIARRAWWLGSHKIRYIPNGVDAARFYAAEPTERATARKLLGMDHEALIVGTVGQLREEKNQERLIRAFAAGSQGRNVQLYIVGEGVLRPRLVKAIADLGLGGRIHLLGLIADPAPFYRTLDLFALSSDTEQMPLSVLEAMATGLPVMSTDVGDVRSMVAAENEAFVTPLADEGAYHSSLNRLLVEPTVRDSLGQANRDKCLREFTLRVMTERYRKLYWEVLSA